MEVDIAVPSAKNSGLDNTLNCTPFPVWSRMLFIVAAVRTGMVDFSTMILDDVATSAICLAQSSINLRSAACPLPFPYVFVGVLTEIKDHFSF
ncbi:Uncharacterised protein [Sphingobacterium daejeonense]|nr:Uncharacterised protein [Sphingobacterium daejeonense]